MAADLRNGTVLVVALAVVACPSEVLVVYPTPEGEGGGGAAASSVMSSSSHVASTSSGGAGCEVACASIASCLVDDGCVARCKSADARCDAEHEAWLDCLVASVDPQTCAFPPDCADELDAWLECLPYGCSVNCPWPGHLSCNCAGMCNDVYLTADCHSQGGAWTCACYMDGTLVGTCAPDDAIASTTPCALTGAKGCCTSVMLGGP